MVVPDLEQICEIMLFSEGFDTAKVCKVLEQCLLSELSNDSDVKDHRKIHYLSSSNDTDVHALHPSALARQADLQASPYFDLLQAEWCSDVLARHVLETR